jgi:hypothetical protein
MSHVAPHRWAELARGKLGDREQQRMLDHADGCAACARARDRVTGAARAFADIAHTAAPELGWDTIRARVYWATSSERRERERTQRMHRVRLRRWGFVAVPAIAAAAAAVVMLAERGTSDNKIASAPPASPGSGSSATHAPPAPVPAPGALTGVVTLAQGGVIVDGASTPATVMAHPITAGASLATTDGRVAVQFGDGSVFALGPRSTLRVVRFDAGAVDLALGDAGDVTIEVAARAPGQRFTVEAGARTIEVRGTAFHVVRRGDTVDVACSHGRVAVHDRSGELAVPAGQGVIVADGEPLADRAARPLDEAALTALAHAIGPRLPVWPAPGDSASLYRTSTPLSIAAPRGRAIRVDGVTVGDGPLVVRVASGRHLVEAATADGRRFAAGEWIEAGPGRDDGRIDARVDVSSALAAIASPAVNPAAARAARQADLEHGLDTGRASACLRPLAKQGVAAGTHVELEISVDASGAIGMLNLGDTDLPARVASCVRDVVATVRFPRGPAATFTHRIDF